MSEQHEKPKRRKLNGPGKPFTSENVPKKTPFGTDRLTIEAKELRKFTRQEAAEVFIRLMFMTREALLVQWKAPEVPIVERIVAGALLRAHKHTDFNVLDQILNRVIGRPGEEIKLTTTTEFEEYVKMSPEERANKREELLAVVALYRENSEKFRQRMEAQNVLPIKDVTPEPSGS